MHVSTSMQAVFVWLGGILTLSDKHGNSRKQVPRAASYNVIQDTYLGAYAPYTSRTSRTQSIDILTKRRGDCGNPADFLSQHSQQDQHLLDGDIVYTALNYTIILHWKGLVILWPAHSAVDLQGVEFMHSRPKQYYNSTYYQNGKQCVL